MAQNAHIFDGFYSQLYSLPNRYIPMIRGWNAHIFNGGLASSPHLGPFISSAQLENLSILLYPPYYHSFTVILPEPDYSELHRCS